MYEVSPLDISMIRNMMLSKANKEISETLDIPVEIVSRVVKDLEQQTGLTCKQTLVEQNRKPRAAKPKKIISKPVVITPTQQNLKYKEERDKKLERSKFQTKQVDLAALQSVRIDEKTTIFIKPGESAVQARMAYLDREKEKNNKLYEKTSFEKRNDKKPIKNN